MFFDNLENRYKIKLNTEQKQAVIHNTGPALVLAGPGSGKTTVITARTAYLILELGVRPENILTMTFNKAAQLEMEDRFNRIYGSDIGRKVHFATMHRVCNLIVRDYERKQGKVLKRIEGEEDTKLSKHIILRGIYQEVNQCRISDDELENLISEISLVKNNMVKDFTNFESNTKSFESIFKAYEEYKKANLLMDFDDMLTFAYSILLKCPDILSYYREKYKYLQIDEGQDLSKIQFEILKLLVPSQPNIFIVADDDQSIYGFRGAAPEYILNIKQQFCDCREYLLETNYRSTKNIVDISSKFIKKNIKRFDKNHRTFNEPLKDPEIEQFKDEEEQTKFIIDKVNKEVRTGRSIGMLYRNNLSSIALVDIFEREGLEFKVKQSKLFFFEHWLVQDILAFFNFALNQCDIDSFTRIYYKMNRFISKNMLENAVNLGYKESIIDGMLKDGNLKQFQIKRLQDLKIEFKKLSKRSPLDALDYIENNFMFFDNVRDYCENTGQVFDYVYGFYGILRNVAKGCLSLETFLQRIEKLKDIFRSPPKAKNGAVTLTTMHSSKGLEYDVVLLIDLIESEIPGVKASQEENRALLEEERRLFYVAMTRARKELYLLSPINKSGIPMPRSIFVNEVQKLIYKSTAQEIGEGMVITHKKFGEGVVAGIYESRDLKTMVEIDFKGVRKSLNLEICIKNKLLVI